MICDQLLAADIKEPFATIADVISNVTVLKTGSCFFFYLSQAVCVRELRSDHVFTHRTDLS